jgi:hypothetical protein
LIQIDQLTLRISEIMRDMAKRKTAHQSDKATLAEVTKEMAKPRVAMSARLESRGLRSNELVVKNDVKK